MSRRLKRAIVVFAALAAPAIGAATASAASIHSQSKGKQVIAQFAVFDTLTCEDGSRPSMQTFFSVLSFETTIKVQGQVTTTAARRTCSSAASIPALSSSRSAPAQVFGGDLPMNALERATLAGHFVLDDGKVLDLNLTLTGTDQYDIGAQDGAAQLREYAGHDTPGRHVPVGGHLGHRDLRRARDRRPARWPRPTRACRETRQARSSSFRAGFRRDDHANFTHHRRWRRPRRVRNFARPRRHDRAFQRAGDVGGFLHGHIGARRAAELHDRHPHLVQRRDLRRAPREPRAPARAGAGSCSSSTTAPEPRRSDRSTFRSAPAACRPGLIPRRSTPAS